jgi:Fic family protein
VYEQLWSLLFLTGDNPYNTSFYQSVHRVLYQQLPQELLSAASLRGQQPAGSPGEWRPTDTPDAPAAKALPGFLRFMASSYGLEAQPDLLARAVNVAVAHYCLGWMQPFGAGNEGVAPLYSEAVIVMTGLSAGGMWSLVRGLARQAPEYQRLLKAVSVVNPTAPDGKSAFSQPHLLAFCRFFLNAMLGELRFMTQLLDRDELLARLKGLVRQLGRRQGWRAEAYYVLEAVYLKGQITRGEVMRLTGLSDKTAKALAQALLAAGFLATDEGNRVAPYRAAYPEATVPVLFPSLYPAPWEQELRVALGVAE